jgi:hypothetical protein
MAFSLKTRVLLGLAAVCLCIVAAPLPVPADAPVRSDVTAQAADKSEVPASRAQAGPGEPSSLDREVVPSLPFTGLDILTLFGVAIALTLLAWILHRLSAPRS